MERYEIEKLRSLPCEGVAQRLGFTVRQHKALCPFHDDHSPSMTFKKNKFRCWSCGENGDTISLVEKVLGKDFLDACHWLANEHNVILTEDMSQTSDIKPRLMPLATSAFSNVPGSTRRLGSSSSMSAALILASSTIAESLHGKTVKALPGCRYLIILRKVASWASRTAT